MKNPAEVIEFKTKLRRLLIVPVGALVLLGSLLSLCILELVSSTRWLDHTYRVIGAANELQTLMIDEETGVRGFLLSRAPVSLEPWKKAQTLIGKEFDDLTRLVSDNPAQEQRLSAIRHHHAVWQQFSQRQINQPYPSSMQTATVLQGKRQMDGLREEVQDFLKTENQLRLLRTGTNDRDLYLLLVSFGILALVLGAVVPLWLFHAINALNQRHQEQAELIYRERQWLQTTLRGIGDAVIATDEEGRVTFMNPVAETCTGWTEHEARNQPLTEVFRIVNETTRAEVENPVARVQRTGAAVCGLANHTLLIRKDNSEVSIDDSGAPIVDSGGRIVGVVLVFRDIESKRIVEKALEASESQLTNFVDSIPTLAWMASEDGWIFWYNRRWYEYTGTTRDQMEGWGWESVHDPDMLPRVLERWTASIRTGSPFEMIFPLRGADGVFRSFLTRVIPVKSDTGLVTRWFGTNTEIDELQRTREELREKSELIELAQAAVNAGYWSYFPDTGECFLSKGEQILLGLVEKARPTLGEIIERVHEADRENVLGALQEGMESGAYFAEFRIQKDDGTIRWVSGQGRVITKDDGAKYMVGVNFDVTNQKLAEEALRKSEKLAVAGRLAAAISHEINNPLESVTNLLYILRSSTNEEQTRQFVMTAEEELARVTHIVTHSLRFHRSSTAPTYEKLSTVLESVAGIYKNRLLLDHIEIKRDYRDQKLVRCYLSELRQVFGNLIGNAFDAIKNGGILCLRSRDAVDVSTGYAGIRVTVADSGHGMDAITLQRLFEPFFTTKGDNGTGLGLWICKGIFNKHHCKVGVRSRSGSHQNGTVFSIFFPLNAIEEPMATTSELAIAASAANKSAKH